MNPFMTLIYRADNLCYSIKNGYIETNSNKDVQLQICNGDIILML